MGAVFGTAFAKSHVYEPEVIRDQFVFKRWVKNAAFGPGASISGFKS
jgi:hypothetical protein